MIQSEQKRFIRGESLESIVVHGTKKRIQAAGDQYGALGTSATSALPFRGARDKRETGCRNDNIDIDKVRTEREAKQGRVQHAPGFLA